MLKIAQAYLATFLLIFISSTFAKEEILISTGAWPPFSSESMKHNGLVGKIIKETLNLMQNMRMMKLSN